MTVPASPPSYLVRFEDARALLQRTIDEDPTLAGLITDQNVYELLRVLEQLAASAVHTGSVQTEVGLAQTFVQTVSLIGPMILRGAAAGRTVRGHRPAIVQMVMQLATVPTAAATILAEGKTATTDADAFGKAVVYRAVEDIDVVDIRSFTARHYDLDLDTYTDLTDDLLSLAASSVAVLPAVPVKWDRFEVTLPAGLMTNAVTLDVVTPLSGITGTWCVYNGHEFQATVLSVGITGSQLTITFALPSDMASASSQAARATFAATGAEQSYRTITASGSYWRITTAVTGDPGDANGHLGQASPSTDPSDYRITMEWLPAEGTDGTSNMTVDGDVEIILPSLLAAPLGARWAPGQADDTTNARRTVAYVVTGGGAVTVPILESVLVDQDVAYAAAELTQGLVVEQQNIGTHGGTADEVFTFGEGEAVFEGARVFIDSGGGPVEWQVVDHLLNADSNDKQVIVRRSTKPDGGFEAIFGDGSNGAIPAGASSVIATYAIQGDVDGNVASKLVKVNGDGVTTVDVFWNSRDASGWQLAEGDSPESFEQLRKDVMAAPRLQGHPTSLEDHEQAAVDWIRSDGSSPVARAFARAHDTDPKTVVITVVAGGGGTLSAGDLADLDDYFNLASTGIALANLTISPQNYTQHILAVTFAVTKNAVAFNGFNTRIGNAVRAYLDPTGAEGTAHRFSPGSTVEVGKILGAVYRTVTEIMQDEYAITMSVPAADVALNSTALPFAGVVTVNGLTA